MAGFIAEIVGLILALDQLAVDLVVASRHPAVTKIMNSVTGLGSATAAAVIVGLFYLADWHEETATAVVALSITGVVVATLMALVQRPFPPDPVCVTRGSEMVAHSFPSGHAAGVTVLGLVAARSERLPVVPAAALAVVIAVSRLYLGTHYLSDTLVGIGIGAAAIWITTHRLADHTRRVESVLQTRRGGDQ
jgi:undecaprenyl-diphosphatase